ncbi:MAG UNVERIFIED_CONTAM: hypothetical protein LVQ98_01530 [Rickettsiaceae bacterium]|jgi:hypothetical protein
MEILSLIKILPKHLHLMVLQMFGATYPQFMERVRVDVESSLVFHKDIKGLDTLNLNSGDTTIEPNTNIEATNFNHKGKLIVNGNLNIKGNYNIEDNASISIPNGGTISVTGGTAVAGDVTLNIVYNKANPEPIIDLTNSTLDLDYMQIL